MKNNFIFIVFDSCRFDSFENARTPFISRLGETKRCYSYASWTVPSHAVYLMGVGPHTSPQGVFASEIYKKDFQQWSDRLNIPDISFRGFVPQLSLPAFLRAHGYETHALVSLPVLNQTTVLNAHFDRYQLMESHNDFSAIIDAMEFDPSTPAFYFINVGETHYPYCIKGESARDLPILHGVHGVFKHMDEHLQKAAEGRLGEEIEFFDQDKMSQLHEKQRKNVEHLDSLFEKLYDIAPANTHIMVTADHGECFGEGGYFGHGPIIHEKVFEVFAVEGKKR